MRPFSFCACAILFASLLPAQTAPSDSFDDLAARAQAEVDSKPAEAVDLFRKALALRPSWPEGWLYMGADLYGLQRYGEAREAFRKGIGLAPSGTAYGFLGLCEYELGDLDPALTDIGKGEMMGLGPNLPFETVVRDRAALILIRAQAFDEALAQLGPLSKRGVNSPDVTEAIGLCALTMARRPETLSARERAVADLAGQASWANMSRRSTEAADGFRELMAKYPDAPGVHYAYGVYQMEVDQHVALAEFEKELKANPAHWPSMLVIAFLKTRDGDPEASIELAQKAMRLQPARNRWVSQAAIGHAYLTMGEPEKAIPALEASVKQQPANTSVHFYLEKAYSLAGRKEDAKREKDEFIRLTRQQDPLSLPIPAGMGGEGATGPAR
jgi:tetratricopeptide (TPR) repeat protein